jgi:hypothetical protein
MTNRIHHLDNYSRCSCFWTQITKRTKNICSELSVTKKQNKPKPLNWVILTNTQFDTRSMLFGQTNPFLSLWSSVQLCGKNYKTNPNIRIFNPKTKVTRENKPKFFCSTAALGCVQVLQNEPKSNPKQERGGGLSSFIQNKPKLEQ